MRAKVLSRPSDVHKQPLEHQIGTVLVEGKEGEVTIQLDNNGKEIGKKFKKYPHGDRRRLFILRFGYCSDRQIDCNFVYPLKESRGP